MDLSAADLLDRLVGFPSVVGTPNGDLMDFVSGELSAHDVPQTAPTCLRPSAMPRARGISCPGMWMLSRRKSRNGTAIPLSCAAKRAG